MSSTTNTDVLQHFDWVHGRARQLTGDANTAADLAQETLLQAVLRPPARRNLRGWLDAVLRNVLRQDLRSEARRTRREAAVARPVNSRPVEDHPLHTLLRESLERLDEPFRTAVVLRYFEGLGIAAISQRTGVPVDTVRSRLRRGLERMRRRLDQRLSKHERRLLAVLSAPFARGSELSWTAGSSWVGVMMASTLWKLGLGVALALAGLWFVLPHLMPDSGGPTPTVVALKEPVELQAEDSAEPAESMVELPETEQERRVVVTSAPAPLEAEPLAPSATTVRTHGWIHDADAAPLSGVRVTLVVAGETTLVTSESDGRLVFETAPDVTGRVACADERYATLLAGELKPASGLEPVLIVAPAIEIGGRVVDVSGLEVRDARVRLRMPDGFQRRFPHVLDASVETTFETRTAPDGQFTLGRVPAVPGAQLWTSRAGYEEDLRPSPLTSRTDLVIELVPRHGAQGDLVGRVIDRAGRPVADARIGGAGETLRTDEAGSFVIDAEQRARTIELVAVHPGHLPARERATETPDGPLWPDFVELRLGAQPLEIAGRIVDAEGRGLFGMRVWVADTTHLAVEEGMPSQVECLLATWRTPASIEQDDEPLGENSNSFWSWDVTDSEGRFLLAGLLEREYRVKAMDMKSLLHVELEGVRAGRQGVELVMDTGRRYAGVVRETTGEPVAGAKVAFLHRAYRVEYGETTSTVWDVSGPEVRTDAEGRFASDGLPESTWLYVSGERVASKAFFLGRDDDRDDLELEVERTDPGVAHFRVELKDSEQADRFELLDPEGVAREVALVRGGSRVTTRSPELVDGVSYVYAVREGRYELVLYQGDAEVSRRWITLVPGDVNVLQP